MLPRAFQRVVLARRWLTFLVLCLSFALFGAGTLNLFNMFSANWDLITNHGVMALRDGAAQQLLELLATLLIAMLNYVVFKACEHSLVQRVLHPADKEPQP
jgi:uncharacterized membrane protein YqhA